MLVMLAVMSLMCNYIVGYINYVQLQYSMLLCYVIHAELGTSDNCCDNLILYEQKTASCRILDADPNPASENCGLTLNFVKITSRTVCCDWPNRWVSAPVFLYRICLYNFNNITVYNNFHTFFLSIFPSWILIHILNAGLDPREKLNADPCGSGSRRETECRSVRVWIQERNGMQIRAGLDPQPWVKVNVTKTLTHKK